MINFKEEVEKRKEQLIQDIETLCAIPSVYNEKTIGENQPYGSECRQALDAMLAISSIISSKLMVNFMVEVLLMIKDLYLLDIMLLKSFMI